MSQPTYGLIGRGRLATHLAHYLTLEQQPFVQWHRGMERSSVDTLAAANVMLLAINDDALEPFVTDNPELSDRPLVHFSGSLTIDGVSGLHPLMTFGRELYELATYRAIPFVCERGGSTFHDVFPALCNPSWTIDPGLKPLYHALCVLAGNFTTLLWSKAFEDFEERLGLPRDVLRPFLERTAANTLGGGSEALTGTLARGDRGTRERDLAALEGDPYGEVYRVIARTFDLEEVRS